MTFIVVFVGLLVERFFNFSHLRHIGWFISFQRFIVDKLKQPSAYINLALSIAPILLVIWFVNHLLGLWLYGFPRLIFHALVFLYALGPQNLWADAFSCINAVAKGDPKVAAVRLQNAFGFGKANNADMLHRTLLSNIFIAANRRVFAVVFWYLLLGPVGVMLYRLVSVSTGVTDTQHKFVESLSTPAQTIESILEWLPARIITVFFALGGQFVQVLSSWRKRIGQGLYSNDDLMAACGMAALGVNAQESFPQDCSIERASLRLIDRSLIIVLIVIGLIWVI